MSKWFLDDIPGTHVGQQLPGLVPKTYPGAHLRRGHNCLLHVVGGSVLEFINICDSFDKSCYLPGTQLEQQSPGNFSAW